RDAVRAGTSVTRQPGTSVTGRRAGAGRKAIPGRRRPVAHRARPAHRAAHPVHVTLRARDDVPSLRLRRPFAALREAIRTASTERFRVIHFSVQSDHVHMIVEAAGRQSLSRGVSGLVIRAARAINRSAIIYVLQNWKKHLHTVAGIDGRSSGAWF